MNVTTIIHISFDDLSEQTKQKIKELEVAGYSVQVKWPRNDYTWDDDFSRGRAINDLVLKAPIPIQTNEKTSEIEKQLEVKC